ncbi:hypothetical protein LTR37_016994 [Vermiconidia calcicola]|uniref:Uncharacterized protein n=1 Tax=Vermiconidia calcicola TaxID=1690605 RepID=A0ACC3MNY9_9PEZI|nr:hypothetical protein LTR37_016994 [Vermiconidia calcicola]
MTQRLLSNLPRLQHNAPLDTFALDRVRKIDLSTVDEERARQLEAKRAHWWKNRDRNFAGRRDSRHETRDLALAGDEDAQRKVDRDNACTAALYHRARNAAAPEGDPEAIAKAQRPKELGKLNKRRQRAKKRAAAAELEDGSERENTEDRVEKWHQGSSCLRSRPVVSTQSSSEGSEGERPTKRRRLRKRAMSERVVVANEETLSNQPHLGSGTSSFTPSASAPEPPVIDLCDTDGNGTVAKKELENRSETKIKLQMRMLALERQEVALQLELLEPEKR